MSFDDLDIRFEEDGHRAKYSVAMPDGSEARLTYVRVGPGHIIADHTFVPVPYRDQDIAERMVERLVADARSNGDKITPTCWFVADEFSRHSPDWDDLLKR
ncbi:MAG: N-acetyltransferase [Rhizobiaceae bacterium]|nr:N-acetyltransferase [Rhizobiaceae bacterium]